MHIDTLGVPYLDADGQVPYHDALEPHCCYGYMTYEGKRFELWDARHEAGRCPVLLLSPDGEIGLLRDISQSLPGYWRELKVGDRVLVDMTETAARAIADELISMREQHPGFIEAMQQQMPSRSAVVANIADALLSAKVAAAQTVTRGMLVAFADAAPAVTVSVVPVRYVSRTSEQIDHREWARLHEDPSYETVLSTRHTLPGGGGRFVCEVRTRWIGVVVNGDPSSTFECTVRLRHACDVPQAECGRGPWLPRGCAANEQQAREFHANVPHGSRRRRRHRLLRCARARDGCQRPCPLAARRTGRDGIAACRR